MKRSTGILVTLVLLDLLRAYHLSNALPLDLKHPEHAAAGEKVVKVSVIKNENSDQKPEDNPPSSTKHKNDEETVEVVANDDGKISSTVFSSATKTTNEDPADHLSLDKLLVDLKNSHKKL